MSNNFVVGNGNYINNLSLFVTTNASNQGGLTFNTSLSNGLYLVSAVEYNSAAYGTCLVRWNGTAISVTSMTTLNITISSSGTTVIFDVANAVSETMYFGIHKLCGS